MADNVTLNSGSGGETLSTDQLAGGEHVQHVKLMDGTADGSTLILAGSGTGAGSLRVNLATDVALPAGTNAIGKLAANSGVDIGDVDVTSVVPGTGATNLGKAEDGAHSSGDTGVMALGVQITNPLDGKKSDTDGDYEVIHINNQRMLVSPNLVQLVDNFSDHTSWSAKNDDCTNVADSTDYYLAGGSATKFDKANGTANTTDALITKTITAVNFLNGITGAAFWQVVCYIPDVTNVTHVVLRLGTDASNYGEWTIAADTATAAQFNSFRVPITQLSAVAGNGWSGSAVDYVEVGLRFSAESDTLTGIIMDAVIYNGGNVVESAEGTEVAGGSVNTNIQKLRGTVIDRNTGNASNGTLRVVLATDQPVVSIDDNSGSITVDNAGTFATQVDGDALTALQLIDNIVQTQDSVAGATDSGVGLMAIRDDEVATVGSDGDYVNLRADEHGLLKVTQIPDATTKAKNAVINASSSGDNTIISAVASTKYRVLALAYICGGTVNVRFEDGAGGTALTGIMEHTAQTGMVLPFNPVGWFETSDNTLLNLELSAAVSVDGLVTYVDI